MKTNQKLAIIGLGNIGAAVADQLSKSPRNFIVSGRNLERVANIAQRWGLAAEVLDIPSAIERADILLLAIPYSEIAPFIREHATALSGKIIIDPSNPIAPDENGSFRKIVKENESGGELISGQLPSDVSLVKAFGTLGVASLQAKAHTMPRHVLFYAGDCLEANVAVEALIQDSGFTPMRIGGIGESARIEVFGALHEFGGAGKALTEEEAKAFI